MRISIYIIFVLLCVACNTAKENAAVNRSTINTNTSPDDSVVYYETDVAVRQQNFFDQLQGRWQIDTMRRQARMQPDVLADAWLQFNRDSSFYAYAGCNRINGQYLLKGTGIRFDKIISTRMACPGDVEAAMLGLLQNTVSAYSIAGNRLLLRDGAGNVIFSASRSANNK